MSLTPNFLAIRPGAIGADELRRTMRHYVTGVTVITAAAEDGGIAGMTANSFTSVSLDPALVLVCLNRSARSFEAALRNGRIAIHVLADDQHAVARGFAMENGHRAAVCRWHNNERGYAILDRYFAVLECRIRDVHPAGDHAIIVSEVEAIDGPAPRSAPLVYHNGNMFGLTDLDSPSRLEPA
jgi:flavin reductase (DIM6/NTAB) family NADH-FMN oxidoreductase RutF